MDNKEQERQERLEFQKKFGEHLKRFREARGITAAELARRCFMERSNIARLEAGRKNPSLFIVKKVCVGLEVEIWELLRGL